jgi:hypothetical protein
MYVDSYGGVIINKQSVHLQQWLIRGEAPLKEQESKNGRNSYRDTSIGKTQKGYTHLLVVICSKHG